MKKIFTFLFVALMSVNMSAKLVQQDIPLTQESWGWGYNSTTVVNDGVLSCSLTGAWGATSTGWDPTTDLSEWDKIIILVENMSGCAGEWFKLKAYLRDYTESEPNQMEGTLGLDAQDDQQNYLVIDLHQDKACDITRARILAIQCQPNGAEFTISRVYLEKEVEDDPINYYIIGTMTDWKVDETFEMIPNNGAEVEEYMFNSLALTTTSQFKVVKVQGEEQTWYPDGMGNNYGENGEITVDGNYTIYFRPNGDGGEGWFYNVIYAALEDPEEGIENIELTKKAQKVVVDGMLYIVRDGKMFNATGAQVK